MHAKVSDLSEMSGRCTNSHVMQIYQKGPRFKDISKQARQNVTPKDAAMGINPASANQVKFQLALKWTIS